MTRLAQLEIHSPDDRGPDGSLSVRVPEAWLISGGKLEVELPRRVHCARCEGGGCDACERTGAVQLSGVDGEEARRVQVHLGPGDARARRVRLRGRGAAGAEDGARGDLFLSLLPGRKADAAVRRGAVLWDRRPLIALGLLILLLLLAALWLRSGTVAQVSEPSARQRGASNTVGAAGARPRRGRRGLAEPHRVWGLG